MGTLVVHEMTCLCAVVRLAQWAVFDKMVFAATHETTFVPDSIYGTTGLGWCF